MNKVILMGRLTADPATTTTPSGVSASRFTIAIDRPYKSQDGTRQADFINCIAWRQQADLINKYFHKGDPCAIVGSIQTRTYEKDGQRRYVTEVVVDNIEFVPKPSGSGTGNGGVSKSIDDLQEIDADDPNLPF